MGDVCTQAARKLVATGGKRGKIARKKRWKMALANAL